MKRKTLPVVALFCLLFVSIVGSVYGQTDDKKDIEYLNLEKETLVLYYPDDMVLDDEQLKSKPEWIKLDEDGTMPSQVTVPSYVKLPRFMNLPEREIPLMNEKGVEEKYTFPAVEIDLQNAIESDRNQVLGSSTAYSVAVYPALTGHCDNKALATVPSSAPISSFTGHTWLPTWTPSHGSVTNWGFQRPVSTTAQLCIPKTLYWIYINPFLGQPYFFVQLGLYNSSGNWSVTY